MKRNVKKKSYYKKAIEAAPILIALMGLVGTLLNFYLSSKLIPLTDSINSVADKANAFYAIHSNDVSRSEFGLIETQVTGIQTQVNQIYRIISGK